MKTNNRKWFIAAVIILIIVVIVGITTTHGTKEQVRYSSSGTQWSDWLGRNEGTSYGK